MKKLIIFILLFSSCQFQGVKNSGREYGFCHAGYSISDKEYDLLDMLGSQWVRIDFTWSNIEKGQGNWDFSFYDAYVEKALSRNKKILAILDYSNPWLGNKKNRYIANHQIPYFLEYVKRTVNRYKGKVTAFEIWNEPNLPHFWKGSKKEFFELHKQALKTIKDIDQEIFVVGGSTALTGAEFIDGMFKYGALDGVDAISFHPYTPRENTAYKNVLRIKNVLDKHNFKGELWITEAGFPTKGFYPWMKSPKKLSRAIVKSLTNYAISGVDKIIWYTLFDEEPESSKKKFLKPEHYFGLVYPDTYNLKKGAYAFSTFAKQVGAKTYDPSFIVNRKKRVRAHLFKDGDNATLVIWYNGLIKRKLDLINTEGPIFSHSIYDSSVKEISSEKIKVGMEPLILTFKMKPRHVLLLK